MSSRPGRATLGDLVSTTATKNKQINNNNNKNGARLGGTHLESQQRHMDLCEFKASLLYRASSRPAGATERSCVKKKSISRGWRDGSAVKNTGFSCRGPRFGSHHPHGC